MELPIIQQILNIATKAGDIIMDFYNQPVQIITKADHSPVTEADIAANDFIVNSLQQITPDIPIVAEESNNNHLAIGADTLWLVDPIDATKSFINKHGEFTVNIALIKNQQPILGVIYAPLTETIYYNEENAAYRQKRGEDATQIHSRALAYNAEQVVLVSSQHNNKRTKEYINTLKVSGVVPVSSSIKFCLIAEGKADIYPRFGKTMEWDIAAGHAILQAAGGTVVDINGKTIFYGKTNFMNDFFVACGTRVDTN